MGTVRFEGEGVTVEIFDIVLNSIYNVPLNENYELDGGYTLYNITITAQEGVTIESVHYIDPEWQSEKSFTITEDGKKATLEEFSIDSETIIFTIVTTGSSGGGGGEEPSLQGFTNIYLVDGTILKSIANEGLIRTWGEPNNVIRVDLREYIINVLELPFSISDDVIGDETPIKLGDYKLETVAKEIKQDLLFLDLGTIIVPAKYGNSFDFMDTTANLYLPFIDVITLDVEYVINQEIHIQYIIDLFSGDTTVNIESSKTGKNIYSNNHKLGRNIPFNAKNNVVNSLSDIGGLYNGIFTPYIEVTRNKVNNLNEFNNMVDIENILLNEKGFIIVNEIDLKTSATSNEKNSIIQLLKNGVYIK